MGEKEGGGEFGVEREECVGNLLKRVWNLREIYKFAYYIEILRIVF
ncbi:MAG: hypothetical protein K2K97_10930 [Muribaculaceae bacterium]|nr:hypothetical protein [Muribaculaceae bacterium]